MRQPIHPLSLAVCVLTLFLVTPALAGARDPVLGMGTEPPRVQLIGWSKDERRIAFRVYTRHVSFEENIGSEVTRVDPLRGEDGYCKGYVDHEGRPFRGGLELAVFERGKEIEVLPIQLETECTAPKEAAEMLADAKKKLAQLGIDLTSTGRECHPENGEEFLVVEEGARAPFDLEVLNDARDTGNEEEGVFYKGKLQLLLHRGDKEQVLWSKAFNRKREDNEEYSALVSAVHLSPSGRRVVVLIHTREGGMRSSSETVSVAAFLDIPRAVTAKAK